MKEKQAKPQTTGEAITDARQELLNGVPQEVIKRVVEAQEVLEQEKQEKLGKVRDSLQPAEIDLFPLRDDGYYHGKKTNFKIKPGEKGKYFLTKGDSQSVQFDVNALKIEGGEWVKPENMGEEDWELVQEFLTTIKTQGIPNLSAQIQEKIEAYLEREEAKKITPSQIIRELHRQQKEDAQELPEPLGNLVSMYYSSFYEAENLRGIQKK